MNITAGREHKPVGVRMPPELKRSLDAAAARNGRSRNSEIVVRLVQSLGLQPDRPTEGPASPGE